MWPLLLVLSAQVPAPLTRAEVVRLAQERAPQVRLAVRAVSEAEASAVGARVPFPANPRLQADVRPLVREAGGPGWAASLEVPVEVAGQGGTRAAEAARRVAVAQAELARERLAAASEASSAYVGLQLARAAVRQAAQALEVGQRVARASEERQAAGAAGETEVAAAALELGLIRAEAAGAERALSEADWRLRSVLDLSPSEALEVPAEVGPPGAPEPVPALVARGLAARPDLQAITARLALLEASRARTTRALIPSPGLLAGADFSPLSTPFVSFGLSLELPVAQRQQGALAGLDAARQTEAERLELERRRLERDVGAAARRLEARLAELTVLVATALPAAERAQALVEQGWKAGRFDIFRVTGSTRELLRLRALELEGLRSAWDARLELDRLTGALTP